MNFSHIHRSRGFDEGLKKHHQYKLEGQKLPNFPLLSITQSELLPDGLSDPRRTSTTCWGAGRGSLEDQDQVVVFKTVWRADGHEVTTVWPPLAPPPHPDPPPSS